MQHTATPAALARSFLFVPATRPERFARALGSGAGCVIVDLEDAVAATEKEAARAQLHDALRGFDTAQLARTLVRSNAVDSEWHADDLRLVGEWCRQGLAGVMLPKAETVTAITEVAAALGPAGQVVPLVESLAGLDSVHLLARAPQVVRLAFGHLDFQLDVGMQCSADEPELASVRFALVAASRRAQLPAPLDGVTVDTADEARLRLDTQRSRAFGFGGKLCIHPAQVAAVNEVLAPTAQELAWAQRVLEAARASGGAVVRVDGKMVDLPVIRWAEQVCARAGDVA